MIGKVTVIKSLALPILVQSFTVLPNPPVRTVKEIQDIFFDFLWNKKVDKIKRNTIIGKYEDGGLKLPHIISFVHALKISWIKRILDPENHAPWKVLVSDVLEEFGQDKFWHFTSNGLKTLSGKFNPFWKDVVNAWSSVRVDLPTAPEEILSQPLWHNERIKIGGRPVFFTRCARANVFFINDLVREDGSLLSLAEFRNTYNIHINFLEFYGLLRAIPENWMRTLRENPVNKLEEIFDKHILLLCVNRKVSKPFYNLFLQNVFEKPLKSQKKWSYDLGLSEEYENWDIIYQTAFRYMLNTKLQSFQYKINLRILYTNSLLLKCGLCETELCSYCFEVKETLLHLFYECPVVRSLWLQFAENMSRCGITVNIAPFECTLGVLNHPNCEILNTCLIIIRYYIYVCRIRKEMINWTKCLETLKYYRNIDLKSLYLCTPRQSQIIKKKWESVKLLFQSDE